MRKLFRSIGCDQVYTDALTPEQARLLREVRLTGMGPVYTGGDRPPEGPPARWRPRSTLPAAEILRQVRVAMLEALSAAKR